MVSNRTQMTSTLAAIPAGGFGYDADDRLTNLGVTGSSGPVASYTYTLDNAGHRTNVSELSGRTVNYGYDNIYRLTSEAIASGPAGNNGTVNYTYDPAGNRTQMTSTLAAIPAGGFGYDADDRLTTDIYDPNGNTVASGGLNYVYDFENHLIQQGAATFVYDGDGNRVQKTVAGVTAKYLISEVNPTGYPQVLSETFSGNSTPPYDLSRMYVYGLDRISQRRSYFTGTQSLTQTSYYVYDGHGSVRALTDPSGSITDAYDYDAFGNVIHQTGTTPNEFLFAGEQFDSNLNLYYNRARYLNVATGRFWTMDTLREVANDPASLHRYLYVRDDPADRLDPTGKQDEIEEAGDEAIEETLDTQSGLNAGPVEDLAEQAVQSENDALFEEGVTWQEAQGQALEDVGGEPQTPFSTSQGTRIVDVYNADTEEAVEVKSGYVNFSDRILTQIDKDEELLQAGQDAEPGTPNVIRKYTWRFYRSPYTGQIGADPRILVALQAAGIAYQIISSF